MRCRRPRIIGIRSLKHGSGFVARKGAIVNEYPGFSVHEAVFALALIDVEGALDSGEEQRWLALRDSVLQFVEVNVIVKGNRQRTQAEEQVW